MGREFVEIFDEWVQSYDSSVAGQDPEYADVFEGYTEILKEVASRAKGNVMEFGSGTGNLTKLLMELGHPVTAVEPNKAMQQATREKVGDIRILDGDLLHYPETKVETFVSTYVFHHLTDEEKIVALKKYAQQLPIGGKVVFADTAFISETAKSAQIAKERARGFHQVADDLEREYYTTVTFLQNAFDEAGFYVHLKQLNDYVWLMDATKKEGVGTLTKKMNVESFNLDHTKVVAPYVRLAGEKTGANGDQILKYDIRFKQPNKEHMEMAGLHSIEHLMAENIRNHTDHVVDIGPMGCQTGFYLTMINHDTYEEVLTILEKTLEDVLEATEVPACNEVQCGWAANHSLEGAKEIAKEMLSKRDEWNVVFAEDAR